MRIKSVHIDGFGKWVDQDFSLAANPQVIYGENEAGKTTLAVFIRSILFGFANAKGKTDRERPRHMAAACWWKLTVSSTGLPGRRGATAAG